MVASIVGDTISEITRRISSLRVFGHKKTITENIIRHLLTIKEVAEHSDATPTPGWLFDVADVVTDLLDLLEDQDIPADAALIPKQSNMTSCLSLCHLTPRGLLLRLEEIEQRLQHIAADLTKLLLKNSKKFTKSDVKDREIETVGRKDAKDKIINLVFAVTDGVPVVMIDGIQGMGKTTLAKLVCDDERVRHYFDLFIWIECIQEEEELYVESIVKSMIHESAAKKKKEKEIEEKDKDLDLREAMNGSRFFLVLDDLQNENREEWLRLLQTLRGAASLSGGAVLVTTHNSLLAHHVDYSHRVALTSLSEEDSWNLFEQVAGESKIRDTHRKIVNKCSGVPIAILTMARMLESHEAITESEIEQLEEEFMEEMKLIYYNKLPSWHLKQCFAYLSFIFPWPFVTNSETLIRVWMAEGLLGPVNSNSISSSSSSPQQPQPEDLGLDYIQEFCRSSILRVGEVDCIKVFTMRHQLMVELSKFVAGKDRFYMDDGDENVKETVRRVSLTHGLDVSHGIPKPLTKSNNSLRTLLFPMPQITLPFPMPQITLPFPMPQITWGSSRIPHEVRLSWSDCDEMFCAFKSLRVLNLSDLGMKVLPFSIGELKSLRYLNLSHNNMKKLPNSIGKLKHLQTLILSHCHQLSELPHTVKHLVSLRHLELEECLHLIHMPPGVKKLTNLQTLSNIVVSPGNNHKHTLDFGELVHMNNLRGELEISHLERLDFKEHDRQAYLKEKQHLQKLTLKWNHDGDGGGGGDEISLQHLEPNSNLR